MYLYLDDLYIVIIQEYMAFTCILIEVTGKAFYYGIFIVLNTE